MSAQGNGQALLKFAVRRAREILLEKGIIGHIPDGDDWAYDEDRRGQFHSPT